MPLGQICISMGDIELNFSVLHPSGNITLTYLSILPEATLKLSPIILIYCCTCPNFAKCSLHIGH